MTDRAAMLDAAARETLAAAVFALDPCGVGGVLLRAPPGVARSAWLGAVAGRASGPVRKVPLGISEDRLLGGLDLAATLAASAPQWQRGVLADADGGIAVLAMAERIGPAAGGRVAQAMDAGRVGDDPARFGAILLDEGIGEDEQAPAALRERVGLHLSLDAPPLGALPDLEAARGLLPRVESGEDAIEALCAAALALGVGSGRAALFALRVARAAAAVGGRTRVAPADVAAAAQLVLAPRATRIPEQEMPEPEPGQAPEAEAPAPDPDDAAPPTPADARALSDQVIEAARAAIPPGLLALLQASKAKARAPGTSGAAVRGPRGRPLGSRPGTPGDGRRLDLLDTLRAAAPWQRVRGGAPPIRLRRGDLRVRQREQRSETTTVFIVDASGSSAVNRLAEAKGAVELLLADCYARRDQVAVIGFRGAAATLLLPPTRSLVRAKRSLAGLPGGGGTPLAAAVEAGRLLADGIRRRGGVPTLVLLTDGQANVGRDGRGGRAQAQADALAAARAVAGHRALVIDTSPRPGPASRALAGAMAARYLALPYADAAALNRSVRALT